MPQVVKMTSNADNKNATEEIRESLTIYGSSVISDKFPNYIDGLKAIQRRIIWFSKDYDSTKGMNKIIGDIGDFHTSGDSSIYEAIIRLSQDFKVGMPLMKVDGKNGEYYAPSKAAAPRYLKAMLAKFSFDIFIKGVNRKTIPMVPTKDFTALEPKYLIPRLPYALMIGNITPGFGFKSVVPMINFNDICDMVMKYADSRQKGEIGSPSPQEYAKYLLPSFPIRNTVINKEEILEHYQQGDFEVPIKLEGVCELSGNNIIFRTVPYINDFGNCTSTFVRMHEAKEKGYKDYKWLSDDIIATHNYSSDITEFHVAIRNNRNPFDVLEEIRSLLRFNDTLAPIYSYTRDDKVDRIDPLRLLVMWYNERYLSIVGGLKYDQAALISEERRINAMLIICDNVRKVIDLITSSDNKQHAINRLFHEFRSRHLSWKQAEIIVNQPLHVLTKISKPDLEAQREQNRLSQEENMAMFGKVHEIIRRDAEELKKEYGSKTPRLTRYNTDYKGYVKYGDYGIIHFCNEKEMYALLNTKGWGSTKKTIHMYDPKYPNKYIIKNGRQVPMIPYHEMSCTDVICYPNERQDITLVVHESEGKVSVVERPLDQKKPGITICPISKHFYAIHKNGSVTEEDYTNFTVRKSLAAGAKSDVIYGLPSKSTDMVAFHMNSAEPNILRIDRILTPNSLGKLHIVPAGKRYLLGFFSIKQKEILLNIPEECRKNVVINHLLITEISKVFEDGDDHHILDVNKTSALSKKLKRTEVKSLFTLDFRSNP